MSEHQWDGPDSNGIRACVRGGCSVRWWEGGRSWQERSGRRWRSVSVIPVPPCANALIDRCAHVERIPLALGPGQTVRGGLRVGQCERPALPRLVMCERHATPDAVRMAILAMAAEIEKVGDLKAFAQYFASMSCMGCKQRPAEFRNDMCTSCTAHHALGLSPGG